jgi:hypothetical protein
VDMIMDRRNMRDDIGGMLALLCSGSLPRPVTGELLQS